MGGDPKKRTRPREEYYNYAKFDQPYDPMGDPRFINDPIGDPRFINDLRGDPRFVNDLRGDPRFANNLRKR